MQEQIVAVQNMQNYIEQHLLEEITLADLAGVSMFSPWHSYRLFKTYTNYTPADYIRRLKLSKSALRLRDEDVTVTELAFEMGFSSVEGYQRAFHREFGCNPKEYAKHPVPIYLFIPYGVLYSEIKREHKKLEEETNVFIQIIHKPERKVIIKRARTAADYFEYCEEVGCEVWGLLCSINSISGEPVCLWLPEEYREPDTGEYVQGVEVPLDYQEEIPEGFDTITLPEADYMLFQGEPFREEEYCAAIEGVQEAIKRFNPLSKGYRFDSTNPRIQLEPIGMRGYMELLPVTAV
ncbi:MAG: helix-turn-helix domain-containing protein [Clostridia bacterium]|nr:helix-turn-helix domain-containing protein [Clostridia bacterium]